MASGTRKAKAAHLAIAARDGVTAERFVTLTSGKQKKVKVPSGHGELGEPPAYFNELQSLCWYEIVEMAPKGVLSGTDRFLVELAAKNLATVRTKLKMTPADSAEMRRCLGEMGMTPAERARLIKPDGGETNPFDEV